MRLSISHQFCEVLRVTCVVEASLYDNEASWYYFWWLRNTYDISNSVLNINICSLSTASYIVVVSAVLTWVIRESTVVQLVSPAIYNKRNSHIFRKGVRMIWETYMDIFTFAILCPPPSPSTIKKASCLFLKVASKG